MNLELMFFMDLPRGLSNCSLYSVSSIIQLGCKKGNSRFGGITMIICKLHVANNMLVPLVYSSYAA